MRTKEAHLFRVHADRPKAHQATPRTTHSQDNLAFRVLRKFMRVIVEEDKAYGYSGSDVTGSRGLRVSCGSDCAPRVGSQSSQGS